MTKQTKVASKVASKKAVQKAGSKKNAIGSKKRTLNPSLKAYSDLMKMIEQELKVKRSGAIMKLAKKFRDPAIQEVGDKTKFEAINRKAMELFKFYLNQKGLKTVLADIEKTNEDIKKKRDAGRSKRGSKK